MYQLKELTTFKNFFHVFSTVDDGNMSLVLNNCKMEMNSVVNNRKNFFNKINIDINRAMNISQQHGNNIVVADEKWLGKTILAQIDSPHADAIVTDKKNVYLVVTVADCVPIILFDPDKKAVGVIHAGWKGTDLKIIQKVIERMVKIFGSTPDNLIAGIGPAVRKESYIKQNPGQKNNPDWKEFIKPVSENLYSVDVIGHNIKQLLEQGIKMENIFDCKINTADDERFFSHSADKNSPNGDRGRFILVAGIQA